MLGERIANLRKEKKVSQEELADVLLTSRQAISKWERGEADPDIDRLKDLAMYFDVSIDYLLGYDMKSTSVNNFINKLKACVDNKTHDISVDEVRMVVSKNQNNFLLLVRAFDYLFTYWIVYQGDNILDLLFDYAERSLVVYQYDKELDVTEYDIKKTIAMIYTIKKDYQKAKDYIEANNLSKDNNLLAECEYNLGNYESASKILSNNFLNSVSDIINANRYQINVLIKRKEYQEAYALTNWSLSFIDSIKKDKNFLSAVFFVLWFQKACLEKIMNLNNDESLKYLKNNYKSIGVDNSTSESMKYYYDKKVNFYVVSKDIDVEFLEEIEKYKDDKKVYQELMFIYNHVFKEE